MSGRERRQFTRVALDAVVRVAIPAHQQRLESRVRDLSENGVFIVAKNTRPIGTELTLTIDVTPDFILEARGIVVHEVRPEDATENRPAGMGIMFVEVLTSIDELRAFIASRPPL